MFRFLEDEIDNREQSSERITYLEKKYDIVFPDILRQLYARTDSNSMKMCEIEVDGVTYVAANLVTLIDGDIDFEYAADDSRDEPMCNFVPSDWYPLAYDNSGNYFYWSSNTHQVYFLDTENVDKQVLMSDSIEAFFELLNNSIGAE
ncbi:MAG: SMI1/KNR4 family protein [Ruminococcus flavefaciens]